MHESPAMTSHRVCELMRKRGANVCPDLEAAVTREFRLARVCGVQEGVRLARESGKPTDELLSELEADARAWMGPAAKPVEPEDVDAMFLDIGCPD